jgi:hypothetical protein
MSLALRLATDRYFLSATNPLATADQRDAEAQALRVMALPEFVNGRRMAEHRWRSFVGLDPGPEAWSRFDAFMDECAFGNVLKAVNGDANYPRVVRLVMPPHEWFGMRVPGSRFGGGPGIDQSYAIVPVDYGSRYELLGRWLDPAPADHVYNLVANGSMTNALAQLEYSQLKVGSDGSFTVTIGPDPAPGRSNHIQTKPGAQYLFVRDCRSDWRQQATALQVRRLDPATRAPWTEEQMAARAAQLMLDDGPAMYVWMRYFANLETNSFAPPLGTAALGGLPSQMVAFARIEISRDEAFVITVEPAGAAFHDIQLNDYWFNAVGDYVTRTSAFNNAQSAPCPDGSMIYVVSIRDPGVLNWLDPAGLHEALIVQRWQRLPPPTAAEKRLPAITGRVVKYNELAAALPPGVPSVDAGGRARQLQERAATYQLRLVDH